MDQLTSIQISEWEAYDKIDPIGSWREDFRFAKLEALIQNIVTMMYCEKGKTPKLKTPMDEMPDWTGDKKEENAEKQSMEEMKAMLLSIAHEQNKRVARENIITPPPKNVEHEYRDINGDPRG